MKDFGVSWVYAIGFLFATNVNDAKHITYGYYFVIVILASFNTVWNDTIWSWILPIDIYHYGSNRNP